MYVKKKKIAKFSNLYKITLKNSLETVLISSWRVLQYFVK